MAAAVALKLRSMDGELESETWKDDRGEVEDEGLERTASEQECDLMIEALRRELDGIKSQLAWLIYHLDEDCAEEIDGQQDEERPATEIESREGAVKLAPEPPRKLSSRLSGARVGVDTPNTARRKAEKTKEELEKAARAALAEKERKKYYMGLVDRAEKDRREFDGEYLRLMKTHVEQQRQQVQENAERLCRKLRNRERKEKALRLQRKPNHFRSRSSANDTTFLNKLYHSTFYQIIGVENEMKKAGKLKGLADLKEFWELMLGPPSPPSPSELLPRTRRRTIATPTRYRPHPLITEDNEEEEDEEFTSWALTALPPEQKKVVRTRQSHKPLSRSQPPIFLPQVRPITDILNCGSPALAKHSGDKEKARAHRHRLQSVQKSKEYTRHMYQQARANEMVMRKLIPDISSLGLEDSDPGETLSLAPQKKVPPAAQSHSREGNSGRSVAAPHRLESTQEQPTITTPPQQALYSRSPEPTNDRLRPSQEKKGDAATPLTINSLLDGEKVKEPKGKSMMWSNYR